MKTPQGWALEIKDGESVWPTVIKPTTRLIVARLMQELRTGPLSPQIEAEPIIFEQPNKGEL